MSWKAVNGSVIVEENG